MIFNDKNRAAGGPKDDTAALVTRYEAELANHVLKTIVETEPVQVYRMAAPCTRIMSTLVTFTPEGVVLQGDFVPSGHGNISALFYSREWFARPLSVDYLASKFLERVYRPDLAWAFVSDSLVSLGDCGESDAHDRVDEAFRDIDFEDEVAFHEAANDACLEVDGAVHGYDTVEHASLIAIQMTFRRLWLARVPS